MKLYPLPFVALAALVAGTGFARPADTSHLLVPGKQVGSISIGENADIALKRLGKEDSGDGAMGRFTSTYIAKSAPHYRLDVYSHRVFPKSGKDKVIVQTVRVESPYFKAANGIQANSLWSAVKAHYPKLKPVARWEPVKTSDPRRCTVYDDVVQGIGFELVDGELRANALYIHKPGEQLQPLAHENTDTWKQVDL